ncbi:hypothetical protein H6F98_12915 [Microcoleus sp. FACHB-SPT15]|nr:hypothetical protein [Microcoleus sp. FACHB-SPT15]
MLIVLRLLLSSLCDRSLSLRYANRNNPNFSRLLNEPRSLLYYHLAPRIRRFDDNATTTSGVRGSKYLEQSYAIG